VSRIHHNIKKKSPRKFKVGLICGGRSVEHDISLDSAQFYLKALKKDIYDVELFKIPREGRWLAVEKLQQCDVILPVLHGTFGEDGTIQGMLEMLDMPYVGPNHRACAVAMDKALTKQLMLYHGIPTAPFISFSEHEWRSEPESIKRQIHFPVFVKPPHLGSSIGVQKVETEETLTQALEHIFRIDTHALVETEIVGRELEYALVGNDNVTVFTPGEILKGDQIHHFDVKYGDNVLPSLPKIDLPQQLMEEGKQLALQAYRAIQCTGMARIDFFLDNEEKFWLNEINPIPGCTKTSLFPKICEANGLDRYQLIDRLIVLALERHRNGTKKTAI